VLAIAILNRGESLHRLDDEIAIGHWMAHHNGTETLAAQ
jgi:hypothetical protein